MGCLAVDFDRVSPDYFVLFDNVADGVISLIFFNLLIVQYLTFGGFLEFSTYEIITYKYRLFDFYFPIWMFLISFLPIISWVIFSVLYQIEVMRWASLSCSEITL